LVFGFFLFGGRNADNLSHAEEKKIRHNLDDLSGKKMNPLLGLKSVDLNFDFVDDDDDGPVSQLSLAQGISHLISFSLSLNPSMASLGRLVAAHFPDDTPEEKAIITRSIDLVFKIALDPSKGWTTEMLPPVAALWYPPADWNRNSEAVFDNDNYLLPDEEMVVALEKELKRVEQLLGKKESQIKSLVQDDLQIDQDIVDREVRKRRDTIRTLEYKQWKITTNIERSGWLFFT